MSPCDRQNLTVLFCSEVRANLPWLPIHESRNVMFTRFATSPTFLINIIGESTPILLNIQHYHTPMIPLPPLKQKIPAPQSSPLFPNKMKCELWTGVARRTDSTPERL
ncbi:hypothetical protein PoB_007400200 [Plakobranchus ocellatus]|uniref:Uncharacterized protein n=1 Tax=Plakobranchus ocellatus TaxID=259542 RepID=A0AAV4DTZ5_9GAST|nr:hypothetical protein PoB_007400200 [Plakobranchus ocellatus]